MEPHLMLLGTIYLILKYTRSNGLMSLEPHIEDPKSSTLFNALGAHEPDNPVYIVLTDLLRLMVSGILNVATIDRYLNAAKATSGLTDQQQSLYGAMQSSIHAALEGYIPKMAVEFGRAHVPFHVKPTYWELENFLNELKVIDGDSVSLDMGKNTRVLKKFFTGLAQS